jgi:hypothetical protein
VLIENEWGGKGTGFFLFDVRYFADRSNFNDYLSIFQKMVNSVTLTDKPLIIQEED